MIPRTSCVRELERGRMKNYPRAIDAHRKMTSVWIIVHTRIKSMRQYYDSRNLVHGHCYVYRRYRKSWKNFNSGRKIKQLYKSVGVYLFTKHTHTAIR